MAHSLCCWERQEEACIELECVCVCVSVATKQHTMHKVCARIEHIGDMDSFGCSFLLFFFASPLDTKHIYKLILLLKYLEGLFAFLLAQQTIDDGHTKERAREIRTPENCHSFRTIGWLAISQSISIQVDGFHFFPSLFLFALTLSRSY